MFVHNLGQCYVNHSERFANVLLHQNRDKYDFLFDSQTLVNGDRCARSFQSLALGYLNYFKLLKASQSKSYHITSHL